jgi:hypothetical protein
MGHQVGRPPKTLEEGARIPVRLAIGQLGSAGDSDGGLGKGESSDEVSGRYFGNDPAIAHSFSCSAVAETFWSPRCDILNLLFFAGCHC